MDNGRLLHKIIKFPDCKFTIFQYAISASQLRETHIECLQHNLKVLCGYLLKIRNLISTVQSDHQEECFKALYLCVGHAGMQDSEMCLLIFY